MTATLAIAALCVLFQAAPAEAGVPPLELRWWVDGGLVFDGLPAGSDTGMGTFRYNGSVFSGGLSLEYSITGDPDPMISAGFTLENTTEATIDVMLEVLLPISPAIPTGTGLDGSVAVSFTADPGGGALTALEGMPFWQGMLDGALAPGTELLPGLDLVLADLGGDAADGAFGVLAGPPVTDSIGIMIGFSLTPGDQVSLTSVFNVVPGPGGLVLLAAGGLVARRRRRR